MIAAEDTRNSIKLLNHFDIHTPMTSYHEYNKISKGRGTFTLDTSALTGTSAIEGTWEEKDGALDLTAEGDTITATVSGSSFKLSSSGVDMTFEKQ